MISKRVSPDDRFQVFDHIASPGSASLDLFDPEIINGPALRAVLAAGLGNAFEFVSHSPGTVADLLLAFPLGRLTLRSGEHIAAAEEAATKRRRLWDQQLQGKDLIDDITAFEALREFELIVRGRAAPIEADGPVWSMVSDAGTEFTFLWEGREAEGNYWASLRISALPGGNRFLYEVGCMVPDRGPIAVPDYGYGSSGSLAWSRLVEWALGAVDLGRQGLEDPSAVLTLLRQRHSGRDAERLPGFSSGQDSFRTMFMPGGRPFREDQQFANRLATLLDLLATSESKPPAARLVKDFKAAEGYAAEYMRYLGFHDASTTPGGADGGVDVRAGAAVAQVKMEGVATGRPVIQALFGVASHEQKVALVFSLAGYTTQAIEWADQAGVGCFEFALDGTITPRSEVAHDLTAKA